MKHTEHSLTYQQVLNDDCLRQLATEIIEDCETCKGDQGEMVCSVCNIFIY